MGEIDFLKSRVVAVILARSGSKSIKDKNIKILNGKPLIAWSIDSCLKCKDIEKIIVSTDSKKYAKISKKYGAHKIIIRPKNISKDNSTDYEAIEHVIRNTRDFNYDLIAHIRPTTPIRDIHDLNLAIKIFRKSNSNSLRSVHEMPESAYKSFEMKNKNQLKPMANLKLKIDDLNNSRQSFAKTYAANGVIDIYRKDFILKNKKLFGSKVMAYITNYTPEIDSLSEFKYIEYIFKNNT